MARQIMKKLDNWISCALKSKIVLYVVFFAALMYLFGLMLNNNIHHTLIFLLVGFLTSFFSKNMIVIMGIAILATWLISLSMQVDYLEGMDNQTSSDETKNNVASTSVTTSENTSTSATTSAPTPAPAPAPAPAPVVSPVATTTPVASPTPAPTSSIQLYNPALKIANDMIDNATDKKTMVDKVQVRKELLNLQNQIVGKLSELEPFLTKAEGFIEKIRTESD